MMLFFFFQAEDGIRDGHVTGVQTCALPICRGRHVRAGRAAAHGRELHGDRAHRPVLWRLAVPSERAMSLKNLAAILDPAAPDGRPLIIQLSPEVDEQLRLSYGEGRQRIAALARGLLNRGLKRGEAVAIVAANSANYLILYMATMAAGLVPVCVNHKLPRETVAHIMKDSAIKLAVADAERAPLVAELVPTVAIERLDSLLDPGPFTAIDMAPEEVAMVLYTSGSTGLPKGVPLTHGGYIWATGATPEQRP